jgi:outer membrane protein assembly factor BamB
MIRLLSRCVPAGAPGGPGAFAGAVRWLIPLLLIQGVAPPAARADDWPQWLGPKRDGVWRETGILDRFPKGGPKVLWRAPLGAGYTGPAVVGNRVYVMDRQAVPLAKGAEGFGKGGLSGKERVLCLNAADGKPVWKHEYDCTYKIYYPSGPRTTPVVDAGKVYTLGAMGDLLCLDAATGKVHWSKNLLEDYKIRPPLWGYAAHPLIDGDRLICLVGGKGSAVAAFDKNTGKELWHALTVKEVGYAPPVIVQAGGKRQLIVFHTEAVTALDPATGKVYWSQPFPIGGEPTRPGITVSTPLQAGDLLYLTSPHHGSLMLKLAADKPAASIVWKSKETSSIEKTDALHSLMSTPLLKDGYLYGVCAFGELRCLKAATGERVWQSYAATAGRKALFANAFLVRQGDRFWIFNDAGDLILARLTPRGYEEVSRAHLLEPTLFSRGRDVVWSHPAFANRCVYVRNDKEIVCVSLAAG